MVRRVLALTSLAALLALGASSALGAEAGEPAGPAACSALIGHETSKPWRVDLWVQCNYEVTELTAKSSNRKLLRVFATPTLFGARPTDSLSCRRKSGAAVCVGGLKPLARADIRLNVHEYACNKPLMRMSITTSGGPGCEPGENCAGYAIALRTPGALGDTHGPCGGH